MRIPILFLSLISAVFLPAAVYAAGEATQCVITLSKVEFKSTFGEWKTAYEGRLPLDIAVPDALVKFDNQSAPEGSYVRVRLTLDETFQVSGSDGGAYTREGGEIEIRGTVSDLEGLPGQIQSLAEKNSTHSEREAGSIRVTLDYDFADRDKIIEVSSSRDFEKPLVIKKSSKISLSMRADLKAAIVHVWPDYYSGFPEKDVMIFDFPRNISELSIKVDGATAFAAGGIDVQF